jgi:hypothetical protein
MVCKAAPGGTGDLLWSQTEPDPEEIQERERFASFPGKPGLERLIRTLKKRASPMGFSRSAASPFACPVVGDRIPSGKLRYGTLSSLSVPCCLMLTFVIPLD